MTNERGFTLAELLVAMAVVGLLMLGWKESIIRGGLRLSISAGHVPAAVILEGFFLYALYVRARRNKRIESADLFAAVCILLFAWILPAGLTSDVGLALLNVPVLLHAAWHQHAQSLLREYLLIRLEVAGDPRAERYWQLLAVINGWPVPPTLVPVFDWFGNYQATAFFDTNMNGFRDAGEMGIPDQAMNLRFRDGSIYQAMATDMSGVAKFNEVFPFFNWLIAEVDFARFKATGATVVVDNGGVVPPHNGWTMPSWNQLNPQPQFDTDPVTGASTATPPRSPATAVTRSMPSERASAATSSLTATRTSTVSPSRSALASSRTGPGTRCCTVAKRRRRLGCTSRPSSRSGSSAASRSVIRSACGPPAMCSVPSATPAAREGAAAAGTSPAARASSASATVHPKSSRSTKCGTKGNDRIGPPDRSACR